MASRCSSHLFWQDVHEVSKVLSDPDFAKAIDIDWPVYAIHGISAVDLDLEGDPAQQ